MSTELAPKNGVITHWTLGAFGVSCCGLVAPGPGVIIVTKVSELSCKNCIRYVSKLDGRIASCDICDRYWLDWEEAALHMLSHD